MCDVGYERERFTVYTQALKTLILKLILAPARSVCKNNSFMNVLLFFRFLFYFILFFSSFWVDVSNHSIKCMNELKFFLLYFLLFLVLFLAFHSFESMIILDFLRIIGWYKENNKNNSALARLKNKTITVMKKKKKN